MPLRPKDAADLAALFKGLAFYGTGGGGSAAAGLALLDQAMGSAWLPAFTDPAELEGDTLACATIVIGGRDPAEQPSAAARAELGAPAEDLPIADRFVRAVRRLEAQLARPIGAVALVELGSVATAATLVAAARLGLPVLDADGSGRCVPALGTSGLDAAGVAACPLTLVDRFGAETVVASAPSAAMADRIARSATRAAWGRGLACAAYPAALATMRPALACGSVAAALSVGRILADGGADRLARLLASTGGRHVLTGLARAPAWRSLEAYGFREVDYTIDGTGEDTGKIATIWIKNEHHHVALDGTTVAVSPETIAVLDADTLEPLTTAGDVESGRPVTVVVTPPLHPVWQATTARQLLDPRRLGRTP